jgi:hypothetical protein
VSRRAGSVGLPIHQRAWSGVGRLRAYVMLLALVRVVAFAADTVVPPQIPSLVTDGALVFDNPSYQSFKRAPFGNPCRICPSDAIQGALNDCALLSALASVAIVSPGTIEKAIIDTGRKDTLGDEIYQISYWDIDHSRWQAVLITSSFPAQTISTAHTLWGNVSQRGYIANALTPFFIYAQLPARDQAWWSRFIIGANDATWVLLMEKGYVAMPWASKGYATPDLMEYADLKNKLPGKGLAPTLTLTQVTGFPTTSHKVRSIKPAKQVASVWIRDSPAVADVGGHSILLGLLHGNLKAVEPNLKTCVAPLGEEHARPICTAPCRESHTCRASLSKPLDTESGRKVHVRVLDVDSRSGAEHEVYAFDVEPGSCTSDKPCTYDVPTSQWVLAGPLEVSFGTTDSDPLEALDTLLARLQKERAAVIVGSLEKVQCPAGDALCAQMFGPPTPLVEGHAYYLKKYVRSPTGPVGDNEVLIGDPHGGELPERTITLNEFYHSFLEIDENPTAHEKSNCTCQ